SLPSMPFIRYLVLESLIISAVLSVRCHIEITVHDSTHAPPDGNEMECPLHVKTCMKIVQSEPKYISKSCGYQDKCKDADYNEYDGDLCVKVDDTITRCCCFG
ncbi:hypothetical protein PMAYCL1PPCAC_27006, partial [Pristionchus mayeri]